MFCFDGFSLYPSPPQGSVPSSHILICYFCFTTLDCLTSKNCNSLESTFAYMRWTVHLPPMKDKGSSVLTAWSQAPYSRAALSVGVTVSELQPILKLQEGLLLKLEDMAPECKHHSSAAQPRQKHWEGARHGLVQRSICFVRRRGQLTSAGLRRGPKWQAACDQVHMSFILPGQQEVTRGHVSKQTQVTPLKPKVWPAHCHLSPPRIDWIKSDGQGSSEGVQEEPASRDGTCTLSGNGHGHSTGALQNWGH